MDDKLNHASAELRERIKDLESRLEKALLQIPRLEAEVARLKEALEFCIKTDATEEYEYGEAIFKSGERPGRGERWKTPREIARDVLKTPFVSDSDSQKGGTA